MLRRYRLGLDWGGLVLFLILMAPNFVWFAVPAPQDVLREESLTPVLDTLAAAAQVFLAAALCLVRRREPAPHHRGWSLTAAALAAGYLLCWAGYDAGITAVPVLLLMCLLPCGAFLCYGIGGKNFAALVPAALFTLLHLIHGIVNFAR